MAEAKLAPATLSRPGRLDGLAAGRVTASKFCGPSGSQDLAFAEREDRPPPSQGGDLPQRVAAHGRRPAYHGTTQATRRNPRQRLWPNSAVFARHTFSTDCHRLPPRGSIKAPCSVVGSGYIVAERTQAQRDLTWRAGSDTRQRAAADAAAQAKRRFGATPRGPRSCRSERDGPAAQSRWAVFISGDAWAMGEKAFPDPCALRPSLLGTRPV